MPKISETKGRYMTKGEKYFNIYDKRLCVNVLNI